MKLSGCQWSVVRKLIFCFALSGVLVAFCLPTQAQQSKKIPRIGYLAAATHSVGSSRPEAFRQGLHDLGYVEGKNIEIEARYAEGKLDRLPALAAELVRLKVDVIVTLSPAATRSAKQATSRIPIVMAADDDPVGSGFAASLAHPGGNITGLSTLAPELSAKQLEILREIVPSISRVAVLGNATQPGNPQALRELNLAADGLGIQLQYLEIQGPKDIDTAFRAASQERADAGLVVSTTVLFVNRRHLSDLAVRSRLTTIYGRPEYVDDGGLVYYGPSYTDLFRRAATYVDKILKGAKPSDLPVEQPTKFELIVNLKAAKQIGVTIPPNVLARADRVIK
jgi:putative ABC transport system substrate-binding protein